MGKEMVHMARYLWFGLMCPGDDGHQFGDLGYFEVWSRGISPIPKAGGPDDRSGDPYQEDGPDGEKDL